LTNFDRVGFRG